MKNPQNSLKIVSLREISRREKNSKLKIVFMGTPEFSVPILEALAREPARLNDFSRSSGSYKVVAVVTKPDEPVGRNQVITPPPVKSFIMEHETWNISILQPEKLKDESFINQVSSFRPDLIVVAAYGKIIPKTILDIPKYGAINVHSSLLPAWRGAAPIQHAILNGDKKTGITIMLMDEEMDHGAIISNAKIQISNDDTYESLSQKLSILGAELLVKTIPGYISGEIKPKEQDHSKATYTKIIKKEDGRIDWSKSAVEIERMVRAFYPWPTTWTIWNSKVLKILEAEVSENNGDHKTGEVFYSNVLKNIGIRCGAGILIIKKLQLEGGKVLTAREFLNGHKDFVGIVLK